MKHWICTDMKLKMGKTKLKTKTFDVKNALWYQGVVFFNAGATVKRQKEIIRSRVENWRF